MAGGHKPEGSSPLQEALGKTVQSLQSPGQGWPIGIPARTSQKLATHPPRCNNEMEAAFVTITVRTPALCLLDTSDKSFLYAYHIRHSPYARFVRTTSLPYLYHPLSVFLCSTYDSFLITNTVVILVH